MAERMSIEQLMNVAYEALPPVGQQVAYSEWYEILRASNPEALKMYKQLKAHGKVRSILTANEDGTISHTVERAV